MNRIDLVVSNLNQIGGVTTHVKRLLPYLAKNNIKYSIQSHPSSKNRALDIFFKSGWFLIFLLKKNHNLVHFHKSFGFFQFFYWYLFSKINSQNILITIHNNNIIHYGNLKQKIVIQFLKHTNYLNLLVVSDNVYDFLKIHGIKCNYLPAYVPPRPKPTILVESDKLIFMYSVYRATKTNLNTIYGFDIALNILVHFKERLNMLFLIGHKEKSDIQLVEKMIAEKDIKENVMLVYNSDIISYIKNCIFLLRPNRKDGYGISLQESMEMNVLAIASNVCKRPNGTIIFNNFNELISLIEKGLRFTVEEKQKIIETRSELTYHLQLIDIYKSYFTN